MLKKVLSVLLACTLVVALSVTAMAAGNVTIKQLVGMDEYETAYVIPNVSGKATYTVSGADENFGGVGGTEPASITAYSIAPGTKIDVSGTHYWSLDKLEEKNGKFTPVKGTLDWDKLVTIAKSEIVEDKVGRKVWGKGSTIQFNAAGYYLFTAQLPTARPDFVGTTVILAVGGSVSDSDKSTTTTKVTDKASAAKPADKNTVKVAGENRTPGEIQNHSSGGYLYTVKSRDTLYDLAKRFYGNGGLWKDLQKANQKWLDETKDGIIFVGYNLIIPSELGGVRANVG